MQGGIRWHSLAPRSAKQVRHGLPEQLALQVPECDVQRAEQAARKIQACRSVVDHVGRQRIHAVQRISHPGAYQVRAGYRLAALAPTIRLIFRRDPYKH